MNHEPASIEAVIKALNLYQQPDNKGKWLNLTTCCERVGISFDTLDRVCKSDKDCGSMRVRARKARAEYTRARHDALMESLADKAIAGDVSAAKVAIGAMQWAMSKDDPEAYAEAKDGLTVNVLQSLDLSGLSDSALQEVTQLLERRLADQARPGSNMLIEGQSTPKG